MHTMPAHAAHVATAINLGLCFVMGVSAMCRLNAMHEGVRRRYAALYVALFVGSVVSGLRFWLFGTFAQWGDVTVAGLIVGALWLDAPAWRHGPPDGILRG